MVIQIKLMFKTNLSDIPDKDLRKIKQQVKKEINWNDITIMVDTREKKHWHIIKYFQNNRINFEETKLDIGDYAFIFQDECFDNLFAIDRKQDINELIGNFKEKRFEAEIERAKSLLYFSIAIEHGMLADIYHGCYKSDMHVNSVIGRLNVFQNYIQFDFLESLDFGIYLVNKIYYFLYSYKIKEVLKL